MFWFYGYKLYKESKINFTYVNKINTYLFVNEFKKNINNILERVRIIYIWFFVGILFMNIYSKI